ncbi:MAG: hypothetical protein WAM97_17445 [Acidimicrobiales bacterium]
MSGQTSPIAVSLSDHLNSVASRCEPGRELRHVRLNTANGWRIAGADEGNPHASARTLPVVTSPPRI